MRGEFLLIQNNHDLFFAVSSLPGSANQPRLLGCYCSVVKRLCCCHDRRCLLRTVKQGGRGGTFKHTMDVTGVKFSGCWACWKLQFFELTVQRLSRDQLLRDYQHYPDRAIRSSEGFQAGEGRWYSAMHNIKCGPYTVIYWRGDSTWGFTREDSAE